MSASFALGRRALLQGLVGLVACGDSSTAPPAASGGAGGAGAAGKAGAAGIAGSAGKAGEAAAGAGGAPAIGDIPFGIWRELRDSVRASAGSLRHEAERLVAKKDAAAIYAFVHERFAARPVLGTNEGREPRTHVAWGRRGLLRSGSGSPRDKVELLRSLLSEAGFSASVVDGPVSAESYWKRVFTYVPARTFEPAIAAARLAELRGLLKLGPATSLPKLGGLEQSASALADALIPLLPESRAVLAPPPGLAASRAPYVRVSVGGKTMVLDPNDPEATYGVDPAGSFGNTDDADEDGARLALTLSMVTAQSSDPVELVKADYPLSTVVGRSVQIGLLPPNGLVSVLLSKLGDVRTFLPAISVGGPDLEPAEREALVRTGAAFTLGGARIDVAGDGLQIDDRVLDTTPFDPASLAKVTSLAVFATGASYPDVRLRVSALDAAGKPVFGLPASAFVVTDEGTRAGASLTENTSRPPRVMFVVDKSSSIPADFRGAPIAEAFRDIATAVRGDFPEAIFQAFSVTSSPESNGWSGDPQALYDQTLAAPASSGSDLWDALGRAAEKDPSFVVLVTDGDATDEPSSKVAGKLAGLPGTVCIKVGDNDGAVLQAIAAASNGTYVATAVVASTKDLVLAELRKAQTQVYAMDYRAGVASTETRSVVVTLAGSSGVSANASYRVPAIEKRVPAPRLAGLLLKIEYGNEAVTRLIAGVPTVRDDTPESVYEEAALACFGSLELRVEGEPATFEALVDELVSARLSAETFVQAVRKHDKTATLDAFLASWDKPDGTALTLANVGASAESGPLTTSGPRLVLASLSPTFGKEIRQRVDVLPIGRLRSLAADPRAAFDEALEGSLRLAVVEGALYDTSTVKSLADVPLAYLAPNGGIADAVPGLPVETERAWSRLLEAYGSSHRLVPKTGELLGFYAVDRATGSALAVLPDGTGGGATRSPIEVDLQWTISSLDWASAVGGAFGIIGLAGGVWIALEKAKLKKLIQATIAIDSLDAPDGADSLDDSIEDVACDVLKGLAGELFGLGARVARPSLSFISFGVNQTLTADSFVEAALGDGFIDCF